MVKIKRVYESESRGDGYRVLVDRLWPRGIKKQDLVLDEWAKEISPSTDLRKSFQHDPGKFAEFQKKYQEELRDPAAQKKLQELIQKAHKRNITLLYSARDEENNNAVVLKRTLEKIISRTTK